jgi:hypothetical protein
LRQARASYLEAAGRLMEGRIALEQEIGGPLENGPAS